MSGVEVCRNAGRSEEATLRIVEGDADDAVLSIGDLLLIFNFRFSVSSDNGLDGERGVESRAKGSSRQIMTEESYFFFTHMHACEPECRPDQSHRSNPKSPVHAFVSCHTERAFPFFRNSVTHSLRWLLRPVQRYIALSFAEWLLCS